MPHPSTPIRLHLHRGLDSAGIVLSALCVVHCLAGVVLVVVLGLGGTLLGAALADPRVHEYGLMLAVTVGAVGLGMGFARHRRRGVLAMGGIGLVLMAAGLIVRHGWAETALTVTGVSLLASAHIRNLRARH